MKHILTPIKYLTVIASLVLAAGCATELQDQENLATAAGFKVITPTKSDQQAILARLPAGKVTPITYHGKSYYVLPDVKNNRAYVGRDKEYQAYQQLRLARQISNDNLMAAQMNEMNSLNWGAWGGWGMAGPVGFW